MMGHLLSWQRSLKHDLFSTRVSTRTILDEYINIKMNILGNEKLTGTVIHSARLLNNRCSFASTTKCLQNFLCSCPCPSTRPTCVGASSVLPFIPLTINCGVLSENLADFNNGNETENVVRYTICNI